MEIIRKNILDVTKFDGVVAHQCNCTTRRAAGVALDIFQRFPYADIYSSRESDDPVGTAVMAVPPDENTDDPVIFNLLAQFRPGRCIVRGVIVEDPGSRLEWMEQAIDRMFFILDESGLYRGPVKIHVPFGMGCGLAGGEWKYYVSLMERKETNKKTFVACKK